MTGVFYNRPGDVIMAGQISTLKTEHIYCACVLAKSMTISAGSRFT